MNDDPKNFAALTADEWGDAEYDAFGALLGVSGDRVPRAGSGHRYDPLDFSVVGHMVRNPALARDFFRYNSYLLQRSPLDVRLRELAILRVAHRRRAAYEWSQHVTSGRANGITDAELDALVEGNDGFQGTDHLVLEACDELLDVGRLDAATWTLLLAELGTHAAMDLIFLVGTYSMLAMAFETWAIAPEPGSEPLPPNWETTS